MNDSGKDVSYRIDRLTHYEVCERMAARPAVILPLGGCEPFGGVGPVGVLTLCVDGIARELSARCRVLSVPALPFGCSTPFMAFPGASGVKPRTFVNMLCEIAHAYVLQGAARVFLVSAAPFNREPAAEAAKRIERKYPGVKASLFDVNLIVNEGVAGLGVDRADAALVAVAAYLSRGVALRLDTPAVVKRRCVDEYRTWKKRGADPQKLRKLFPDGLLLLDSITPDVSPERGRELFELIVKSIQLSIDAEMTF